MKTVITRNDSGQSNHQGYEIEDKVISFRLNFSYMERASLSDNMSINMVGVSLVQQQAYHLIMEVEPEQRKRPAQI